jgi:hypothetical protein
MNKPPTLPTPKFRLTRLFWIGIILFVVGTGPLLAIIIAASLGLTRDPNPNPIFLGILAGLTIWPSVGFIIGGFVQSCSRYRTLQEKSREE